ncbi:helix-turn-helix domain-containing protein [Alkalibaculum sporogenes]|nr:helix-turn-helix domain-containing protein [Alkalibaculum sporogenes]
MNKFVTSIRVENSKKLLVNTDYKLWQICEKVGFSNSKYFSQVFKKIVGVSPKEM